MKNSLKKIVVFGSVITLSLVGLTGCSNSDSKNNEDSFVIGLEDKNTISTEGLSSEAQAEVSKVTQDFFNDYMIETNSHVKKYGEDVLSIADKPTEYFEKHFPKTLSKVSDSDEAINFILAYYSSFKYAKISKIEVRESNFDFNGGEVSFDGADVKVTVDGEVTQARKIDGVEVGKFVLEFENDEWKFTELDTTSQNALKVKSSQLSEIAKKAAKEIN